MPSPGITVHYRPPQGVWQTGDAESVTVPEGSESFITVVGPDGVSYPMRFPSLDVARKFYAGLDRFQAIAAGRCRADGMCKQQGWLSISVARNQALDAYADGASKEQAREVWEGVFEQLRDLWGRDVLGLADRPYEHEEDDDEDEGLTPD